MKNTIIASTSTVYGSDYLSYLLPVLEQHFANCETILFIPYARPGGITHDEYTSKVAESFKKINKKVVGIHTYDDPALAVANAQAIFTGGGNTFVLVNQLYATGVMTALRDVLMNTDVPYLGTSAGSNICGLSIQTTNDMPIVYPPSFQTLGIVPFNINPHFIDGNQIAGHMGETRETRITEFHAFNNFPVIGLREGSWIETHNDSIVLKGPHSAKIFKQGVEPYELSPNSDLKTL